MGKIYNVSTFIKLRYLSKGSLRMSDIKKPPVISEPPRTQEKVSDPNQLMGYVAYTHAPLINGVVNKLIESKKIPHDEEDPQYERSAWHIPALHGLMEAIHTYEPHLGSFKNHAWTKMTSRILEHAKTLDEIPKNMRVEARAHRLLNDKIEFEKYFGTGSFPTKSEED